ncbi:Aspartate ammonia-lyase [groundwater metagenome]|uniref:Aspartate ammonia-lyase n=1 Tax=groundwater metagenome TaxID=717931 RepID=A0A098EAY4_9ZZZZ
MIFRIEKDSLGEKDVPCDAYFGIHSLRSVENFQISGIVMPEEIIKAIIYLKICCAKANLELETIDKRKGKAIINASEEILKNFEKYKSQFPIDIFQAGSGTSLNMNINEVIANLAVEISENKKENFGKKIIHPNDDVNKGQSTNDVMPSAIKISAYLLSENLICALENLENVLSDKGNEFKDILKSGRTHLQDAVPMTLGQEFQAYGRAIEKDIKRVNFAKKFILELAIGGNAIGTGINTNPKFRELVVKNLNEILNKSFEKAENGIESVQFLTDIANFSSALKMLAIDLNKISNDLRLLNSGPYTGFNEIFLPAVEPGSSIMPGKINPSICEAINQVSFKVFGNDLTITNSCAAGQLELNTHMPVIAYSLIESIKILTNGINIFTKKAVKDIKANEERCKFYAENSLSLITALNPILGYDKCEEIAKEAKRTNKGIKEIIIEKEYLSKEEVNKFLNVKFLTGQNLK